MYNFLAILQMIIHIIIHIMTSMDYPYLVIWNNTLHNQTLRSIKSENTETEIMIFISFDLINKSVFHINNGDGKK